MTDRPAVWTLCGAVALAVVCLGSVGLLPPFPGSPTPAAPGSVLLVLPIFYSESWGLAALAVWPLAFLAWAHPLLRGSGDFPRRTSILWAVVLGLSVLLYWQGWRLGLQYQGAAYTWGCLGASLMLSAASLFCALSCRGRPSFPWNLAAHWLLFAWMVTYAFPYLGETP